jgi:hypothetical protein
MAYVAGLDYNSSPINKIDKIKDCRLCIVVDVESDQVDLYSFELCPATISFNSFLYACC